jgi:hypothetical protein
MAGSRQFSQGCFRSALVGLAVYCHPGTGGRELKGDRAADPA